MVINKIIKILTKDDATNRFMDQVIKAVNSLVSDPQANKSYLSGVVVVSGQNVIPHGLGRKLLGYYIVSSNANVTFYDNQATNSTPELNLLLVASGTATINLVVF